MKGPQVLAGTLGLVTWSQICTSIPMAYTVPAHCYSQKLPRHKTTTPTSVFALAACYPDPVTSNPPQGSMGQRQHSQSLWVHLALDSWLSCQP